VTVVDARIDMKSISASRLDAAGSLSQGPASCYVTIGVPVVVLRGRLQRRHFLDYRSVLGVACGVRAGLVVLDLRRAVVEHGSVPVLALMRRYCARRGARLVLLTDAFTDDVLRRAGVLPLFRTAPTLAAAVRQADPTASSEGRTVPDGG
jgi:hypothetical protein